MLDTPTATSSPTATAIIAAAPVQPPVDDDDDDEDDEEERSEQRIEPTITPSPFIRYSPAQSCLTLQPYIVVNNASSGTSCQRVEGMGIGHPDVIAAMPSAVVDIWGWVTPNTEVCFWESSGAIKFIDTTLLPRTVTDLPAYSQPNSYTCAVINGAGQVALVPGQPAPQMQAPAPQAQGNQSLSGCMVRLRYALNLRFEPAGEVIDIIPYNANLTALERTDDWFKVDYHGAHGWIAAEYVAPEGDCG